MTDQIEERPDAQVRIVRGDMIGQVFRVTDEQVVGRGDGAAIRLDDSRVSRVHARFGLGAEGLTLTDLGSANGSFVNGQRIDGPTILALGDLVRFGGSTLRVDRLELPADDRAMRTGPVLFPPLVTPTLTATPDDVEPEASLEELPLPAPVPPPPVVPLLPPPVVPPAPVLPPAPPAIATVLPPPPPRPYGPRPAPELGATRELPVALVGSERPRQRGLLLAAAAIVIVALVGGGAAVLATRGGSDEVATSAPDTSAATGSAPTTAVPVALPFTAGTCLNLPARTGESPTAVACDAPEAYSRVTEIRAGTDLTCASGATRTSVERTKDGVTTSYAYCSTRLPERDGQLDVGSCLVGTTASDGKLNIDERNCADVAANYRVTGSAETAAACPSTASKSIEKSTAEVARTSAGRWCLTLIEGRRP